MQEGNRWKKDMCGRSGGGEAVGEGKREGKGVETIRGEVERWKAVAEERGAERERGKRRWNRLV